MFYSGNNNPTHAVKSKLVNHFLLHSHTQFVFTSTKIDSTSAVFSPHRAPEIFIQIAIYNHPHFMTAACIIHLHSCPNAFLLFRRRNQIMGGLGTLETRMFPHLLTNANVLIWAFIPQDQKHYFMITSVLETCLIIPNYASQPLVRSVSSSMLPEQHLACCSACVQSPWYHRWACFPS